MKNKNFNIIVMLYILYSISVMTGTIAKVNYIQYHWNVRMDYIELFTGFNHIEQNELSLLYNLSIFFAGMFLSYYAIYELHFKKSLLFLILCFMVVLFRYPITLTYLFVWPIKMSDLIFTLFNMRMTALIKYMLAIFNLVILAYVYKVVRGMKT